MQMLTFSSETTIPNGSQIKCLTLTCGINVNIFSAIALNGAWDHK